MQEQIIPPSRAEPAWLIGASSYLADRIVPDCERIQLPAREISGGLLRFGRAPLISKPVRSGRLGRLSTLMRSKPPVALPHNNVFDLRRNTPENWAHFLNNHLPIVFRVCTELGISPADTLLVLPAGIPDYIKGAAGVFGIDVLATDALLEGDGLHYDVDPWTGVRAQRAAWVETPFVHNVLTSIDAGSGTADLPERVFLSRRGSRAPLNEAELMAWLEPKGFVRVYPEDLSPSDQIRLFRQAEVMVAVHGAGLAPLLYTQGGGRLRKLVEVLHAGHMTDNFRVMAEQVGCDWIGVRGRLKPEYIRPAYDFRQDFRDYSLDNFEVDLAALEEAFGMAGID